MVDSEAANARTTAITNHNVRWSSGTSRAHSIITVKNTVRYQDNWNAQREFSTSATLNHVAPMTSTAIGVRRLQRYFRVRTNSPVYVAMKTTALKKITERRSSWSANPNTTSI